MINQEEIREIIREINKSYRINFYYLIIKNKTLKILCNS